MYPKRQNLEQNSNYLISTSLSKNYIEARVNRHFSKILLDTGSNFSLAHADFVQNTLRLPVQEASHYQTVMTACGKRLVLKNVVNLTITVSGMSMDFIFYVTDALNPRFSVIVGLDFFREFNAQFDFLNNVVTFDNERAVTTVISSPSPGVILTPQESTFIPPFSETITSVCTPPKFEGKQIYMESFRFPKQIIVAHTIGTVQNQRVPCKLINFTNQPVTLRPNTRLIQAYFLPRTEHLPHVGKATISSVLEEPSFDNNSCYTLTETTSADDLLNIAEDELWTRLAALKIDFQKCLLQPEQKIILARLILWNSDLFAKHSFDIGKCPYIQHDIQLHPDAKPFYQRNYPHSPEVKQIVHDQVQTYLKAGIVEESNSFFNSNLLAIRKPSGQHRIVADMRHLNKLSILPIHQPLPIADDIFRGIAQSKPALFTTIDINQAYMHVKLTENARPLAAFSCSGQQKYHYTRMIPGLAGATQTFQRLGERILAGINHLYATSYLDDFIIFSQTFEDHINHLTDVLYRLRRANLKISPSKCTWAAPEIKFLGFIINQVGHTPDPARLNLIDQIKPPANAKELKSCLGIFSYNRKYILNYAAISRVLYSLLKKDAKFVWTSVHQEAFDTLKARLRSPLTLTHPDFSLPFYLSTDASSVALSYALHQTQGGHEKTVTCGSKFSTPAQSNYSNTTLETMAIVT